MRVMSRNELLSLTEEQLIGTAECHGFVTEGLTIGEIVDGFDDWLQDLRILYGEDE